MSRLTDEVLAELHAAFDHDTNMGHEVCLTTPSTLRDAFAELRERRAADAEKFDATVAVIGNDDGRIRRTFLTGREMEALKWLREWVEPRLDITAGEAVDCPHCVQSRAALSVLDRLLSHAGGDK